MMKGNTLFGQIQAFIPRGIFREIVTRYRGNHKVHFVDCWSHFLCLLWAQLTHRTSLRDIEMTATPRQAFLKQFGFVSSRRCSVARANARRPWQVAQALFECLLMRCQSSAPGHGFRFKNPLYSLDATVIDLCLSLFDWAHFRSTKGGLKLHVLLDHRGRLPTFVQVTEARLHEIRVARTLRLPTGSILCFDRAYLDFTWFWHLTQQGVSLVTRLKSNARFKVVERRKACRRQGVMSDHIVRLTGFYSSQDYPGVLRRIRYVDATTGKVYVFLTTNMTLAATTIAQIYKARWQIEIFFKWIKQNLKIKTFYGTSKNAVLWQIFTALCLYLLLAYFKFKLRSTWSLRKIHRLLADYLYESVNLAVFLNGNCRFAT